MKDKSFLEVCVDSVESALEAQKGGADRLELCADLIIGGTTPPESLFRTIRKVVNLPIHVMVRPRYGDFLYSDYEYEVMLDTVSSFRNLGADGVVTGILKADGNLDCERMSRIREMSEGMKLTLHRAFDMSCDPQSAMSGALSCDSQFAMSGALNCGSQSAMSGTLNSDSQSAVSGALNCGSQSAMSGTLNSDSQSAMSGGLNCGSRSVMNDAVNCGVDIVLTSGRAPSAEEGIPVLRELQEKYGSRIEIMAGAGVSARNILLIHEKTGIRNFHLSGKKEIPSGMVFRNERVSMGVPGFPEYSIMRTAAENVRTAARVCHGGQL